MLINNIAWLLRHLPVFAVGGRGDYRIRGIHIDDLAEIAADAGASGNDAIIDAVGPDRPTFTELVHAIRTAVGSRSRIIRVPGALVPVATRSLGAVLHDVLLTKDEYQAMAANLADTSGLSTGHTSLLAWIEQNASRLGVSYANELDRHFRLSPTCR